ncbi:hypothetical protein BC938DRAFT_478847 [Jimgerdemannia flammicorona]|uniref:Methyltransferase domain-containing protein n=1 Tax=Jimgerdemannia flammicorona TaxID=994334 RepID=A0A433QM56_9FUNG|nr:hypothetical protein BC938DRAFT_478847 [Jimgerdemannia flammicorona]
MANLYPSSTFTGTDLVDAFLDSLGSITPPLNLTFQVVDTLKGLPFPDASFDYVVQRFGALSFSELQLPGVIRELARVVKPGGWIEFVDTDASPHGGPLLTELWSKGAYLIIGFRLSQVNLMLTMRDINATKIQCLHEDLFELGFEQITYNQVLLPIGWGPSEVGSGTARNLTRAHDSLKPQMTLVLGIGNSEFDRMAEDAEEESKESKAYWDIYYTFGRKPEISNVE